MQKQLDEFLAVFAAAYPYLNREDKFALEEMAKLWASRNLSRPTLRLVASPTGVNTINQKTG